MPFFARWPGQIEPGSRCDQTICLTDLLATCAETAGAERPDAAKDSFTLLPWLLGKSLSQNQKTPTPLNFLDSRASPEDGGGRFSN